MIKLQNGKADEEYERIKNQKAAEMEARRRSMEQRCEKKRHLRELHIERKQVLEAEKLRRDKEDAELKARQLERTQRLAEELARRKHIELQESLKSKKTKFAVPFVSNEALQKIQGELIKQKKQDEEVQSSKISSPWDFNEEAEIKQHEKKLNYRRDLQNQLIDNRLRLREKEEEKHRERKIMEEVEDVMHQEDIEAEKMKRKVAALLQAEKDAFLKARQFWKEKRREVLKQEQEEIARIIAKREALRKKEAEEKSDTRAAKDATLEKMMSKMVEEERKRTEREEICRELYLAEKEHELANEETKLAWKKKRTARELLKDMERSQKAIADRKAKENAIDAAFAKYLAEERKKEEEKEKLKEQERREKVAQYGNELRDMIMKRKIQNLNDAAQTQSKTSINYENRKSKCYSESTLEVLKSQEAKNNLF